MYISEREQKEQIARHFAYTGKVCGCEKKQPETLESVIAELRQLESDPQVRLADEEEDLMESLKLIREILRKKKARGLDLEAQGITMELIRRYRKDYAETDWGA